MRIALTGSLYAGKTTLAKYMEEKHGWYRMDYTGLLKEYLAVAISKAEGRRVSVAEIEGNKGRYRRVLQELGSALGFDQGFGVDTSLRRWKRNRRWDQDSVIFDNVRFEPQFETLKCQGFVLVGLTLDYRNQQKRASALGIDPETLDAMLEHSSEYGVLPELKLNAALPTEEMADILLRLDGLVTLHSTRVARLA